MPSIDDTINLLNSSLESLKTALSSAQKLERMSPGDLQVIGEAIASTQKARDHFIHTAYKLGTQRELKVRGPWKMKRKATTA
jgi:hypothetical protein